MRCGKRWRQHIHMQALLLAGQRVIYRSAEGDFAYQRQPDGTTKVTPIEKRPAPDAPAPTYDEAES
jgi:hypothetical protein